MSTQTLYVGTGTDAGSGNPSGSNENWTSPGNITTADGVNATCNVGALNSVIDNSVKIIKGGTISGTDQSAGLTWSGALRVDSFGSSSNLWGLSWLPSDINSGGFGCAVSGHDGSVTTNITNYLEGTMTGNLFSIPTGSTINGIQVNVNRGSLCFVEGTLVATVLGPRPIESLHVGDMILSWGEKGIVYGDPLQASRKSEATNLLRIRTDRREVLCTPTHPFEAIRGKVNANKLMVNEDVLVIDNNSVGLEAITEISSVQKKTSIYSLTVANHHTFFASGFAVHNKLNEVANVDYMQISVDYTPSDVSLPKFLQSVARNTQFFTQF